MGSSGGRFRSLVESRVYMGEAGEGVLKEEALWKELLHLLCSPRFNGCIQVGELSVYIGRKHLNRGGRVCKQAPRKDCGGKAREEKNQPPDETKQTYRKVSMRRSRALLPGQSSS